MTDDLSSLPVNDNTQLTPDEENTINRFFPQSTSVGKKDDDKSDWKPLLKLAGYSSILFIALANPFIDHLLVMVPYLQSDLYLLLFKVMLFFIVPGREKSDAR